jgi:nucleoside recognition membrane protein YjiH
MPVMGRSNLVDPRRFVITCFSVSDSEKLSISCPLFLSTYVSGDFSNFPLHH